MGRQGANKSNRAVHGQIGSPWRAYSHGLSESVTRGDRRGRELGLEGSSPPLACLLLESLADSGGNQWSGAGAFNHTIIH
jgi:hypothetical protein